MKLEIIISTVAIAISFFSLFINFYEMYRNKSKLKVWAKILYAEDIYSDFENKKYNPILQIFIVNKGLRPIIINDICISFNDGSLRCNCLKEESKTLDIRLNDINSLKKIEKLMVDNGLSHVYGIKLEDGDVFEIRIKHDDLYKYYDFEKGAAYKFFIRDIFGTNHYVKNSKKYLKVLLATNKGVL